MHITPFEEKIKNFGYGIWDIKKYIIYYNYSKVRILTIVINNNNRHLILYVLNFTPWSIIKHMIIDK